jgi:hypothetical protein
VDERVKRRGCCDLVAERSDRRGRGEGEGGAIFVEWLALDEVVETDAARRRGPGRRSSEMELIVEPLDGEGEGVRVFALDTRAYG